MLDHTSPAVLSFGGVEGCKITARGDSIRFVVPSMYKGQEMEGVVVVVVVGGGGP